MVQRKGLVWAAACAALACAGIVRAESAPAVAGDGLASRPVMLDAAATVPATVPDTTPASAPASAPATTPATPPTPLMGLLETCGIAKPIEDAKITISGFVEGGYTVSASKPPGDLILGRFQDTKDNSIVLDQFDIAVDRPVDYGAAATNHTWDIGGHAEFVYGWDAGLFHSSGLLDNPAVPGVTNGTYRSRTSPENQADILQAYLDFALPVGTGLRVRAGKFVTLLGYEGIGPTSNPFYSHSYLFSFAVPLTQTGIETEYALNSDIKFDAGITRGWSQTFKDNNGEPDFLGNVTYTPQESDFLKKWKAVLALSFGPQATHDNHDYWTVADFQLTYQATGDGAAPGSLLYALNADYGDAPHALPTSSGQWYGAAGYVQYIATTVFTINGRIEWYDDANGFTLGTGSATDVYEATLGLKITPFPDDNIGKNFALRPEIRYDYSSKDFFNGGTKHQQATFGIDAYFTF